MLDFPASHGRLPEVSHEKGLGKTPLQLSLLSPERKNECPSPRVQLVGMLVPFLISEIIGGSSVAPENQWRPPLKGQDALLDGLHCSLEEWPWVLHAQRGKGPKAVPQERTNHRWNDCAWKKSCASW